MNYVKSVITNFIGLAFICFFASIGNSYRFFSRQSAQDMGAAEFLVSLVFLITCVAFAAYYFPAAKKRSESFVPIDQKVLRKYMKRSITILVIGSLVVLALSVINGIFVLLGSGGYFSTILVIMSIIIFAVLYLMGFRYFQPKGVYLNTNEDPS